MFTIWDHTYSSVGDIICVVICITCCFLMISSYSDNKKRTRLFFVANGLLMGAAVCSLVFHGCQKVLPEHAMIYLNILESIYFSLLIGVFEIFVIYLCDVLRVEKEMAGKVKQISMALLSVMILIEMVIPVASILRGDWGEASCHGRSYRNTFLFFYVVYCMISAWLLSRYRKHIVTKMRYCIQNVMAIAVFVMLLQLIHGQCSFTSMTFNLPIVAVMYLFHYNAYDMELGTLDFASYPSYVGNIKGEYSFIYIYLTEIDVKRNPGLSEQFIHFNEQFFGDQCIFRIDKHRMVLVYAQDKNPDAKEKYPKLLELFKDLYHQYQIPYKIIFADSSASITQPQEYIELCKHIEAGMEMLEVRAVLDEDIDRFVRRIHIRRALKDIDEKADLNDERVLVYAQPVLDVKLQRYTTAEALMRLQLPEFGIVYPDEFIPVAEQYDYIHRLSMIILSKTCHMIRQFLDEGYHFERISVNISSQELGKPMFCEDIKHMIEQSGIGCEKIAIELTESQNEGDYNMVKNIMKVLQREGIRFYLDDFGTGYSNFARIVNLPFDTIKFDRLMTQVSGKDYDSRYMIKNFADIFSNAGYSILFEGVENEEDESRCVEMNATYLQGYKYEKPIPIEDLREYFRK